MPEMTEALKIGRELDALIEERVFGKSLSVPRERAMAILGATYVSVTGRRFKLDVHGRELSIDMPNGNTLPGHETDDNFNQRYFRYVVAELLKFPNEIGETVARDLASIRNTPSPYSTDIAAAMQVVAEVQRQQPGWRFMLLGGDESYGYRKGKRGEPEFVAVPSVRERFGWRASFFGNIDPTQSGGERHADEWGETPALAVCRAALVSRGSST